MHKLNSWLIAKAKNQVREQGRIDIDLMTQMNDAGLMAFEIERQLIEEISNEEN